MSGPIGGGIVQTVISGSFGPERGTTGFKGDPGGNAMAVGLWTSFSALTIAIGWDAVKTSGYATVGIGGAFYTVVAENDDEAAELGLVQSFYVGRSFNGRWFEIAETDPTVDQFGAIGDGVVDDQQALNDAGAYARRFLKSITLTGGAVYRVTRSINWTKDNPNDRQIIVRCTGRTATILGDLVEAFPVIDFTDNKRGELQSIEIDTTQTSLDSCTVLAAETQPTGANLIQFVNCKIKNRSPNAKATVIGICADQIRFDRSEIETTGPAAVEGTMLSGVLISGIASKFKTIAAFAADRTYVTLSHSNFVARNVPPLSITGFNAVNQNDCYFSVIGTAAPIGMVKITSLDRRTNLVWHGFRTENQTVDASSNISTFWIVDGLFNTDITGNSATRGALFAGPGTLREVRYKGERNGPLFSDIGSMRDCTFSCGGGSNLLGTFAAGAVIGSANLHFSGRAASYTDLMAAFSTVPGLVLENVGVEDGSPVNGGRRTGIYASKMYPRADSPTGWRQSLKSSCLLPVLTNYVGGSGAQPICTLSFPTALLAWGAVDQTRFALPSGRAKFRAGLKSVWGSGSIGISISQVSQSSVTISLGLGLLNIPAGHAGLTATFEVMRVNTIGNLVVDVEISAAPYDGGPPVMLKRRVGLDLGPDMFDLTNPNPFTFTMWVTNPISDPLDAVITSVEG